MKSPFEGVTPIYFPLIRPQGELFFVDVYTDLVVIRPQGELFFVDVYTDLVVVEMER